VAVERRPEALLKLMAILSIAGNIIPAVSALEMTNIQLQESKVAFDRMFEFVNIETEPRLRSVANGLEFSNLEIKNLSFRFIGRKLLLKNISLNVKKGEMIALWGESGSGKSTLIQIIQRFYEVDSGKIVVNSEDWNKIDTKAWRDILGVVPQQTKLFNGTLLDNICLENTCKKTNLYCNQCRHNYHILCMNKWIKKSIERNCPICRKNINSTTIPNYQFYYDFYNF
jgi:ATP-binding cassette subfamily B protein